jgi:hypothetical protein
MAYQKKEKGEVRDTGAGVWRIKKKKRVRVRDRGTGA